MRYACASALVALIAGASACGGDPPKPDGAPAGKIYSLTWGPITVAPGLEDTRCVTLQLDNQTAIKVHEFHNVLGGVSHHFIVYRVAGETENSTPTPCQPFTDTLDASKGSPLLISQKKDDTLTLPDGVGYSFAAGQQIRLEMHFINTLDTPQELSATATFVTMDDGDFKNEADFLFIGSPDISLPAGQTASLSAYFPMLPEFADANFFAITGHEHQLGTGVTVKTATDATSEGTTVYDPPSFSWNEPPTVMPAPPFQLPANGGFQFTCTWDNTTGGHVGFGEKTTDEMCFFWAYYYPSHGAKVCIHTTQAGGHDICCPGDGLCVLINDFLNQQ